MTRTNSNHFEGRKLKGPNCFFIKH